ncbi:MAG: PadR family transcriptional regulator [Candidatus Dormibacteria bacterium]
MPTTPRFTRTPAALVVLNLLCERPRHTYALRLLIRERGIDSAVRVGAASLYDAVQRLERLGFIAAQEPSREGRRPERTVYSITVRGRDELGEWMADLLSEPSHEYPQFASALAFVLGVGRDRTVRLLRSRLLRLESAAAAYRRLGESMGAMPRIVLIEGEYGQAIREAEQGFVERLIADIESGALWSDAEIERLFAMTSLADMADEDGMPAEMARAKHKLQTRRERGERSPRPTPRGDTP